MKQWYYVKNAEEYVVLELAENASSAKSRARTRPGFDNDDTVAWPKACMPMGVDNMQAERPVRKF